MNQYVGSKAKELKSLQNSALGKSLDHYTSTEVYSLISCSGGIAISFYRLSHDVLFKVVCNLIHECSGKLYIALKQFFTQSVMRTMESQNPGSSVEDIEAFYY